MYILFANREYAMVFLCLVAHGDVGQTFMYGAKGGEVYIRATPPAGR